MAEKIDYDKAHRQNLFVVAVHIDKIFRAAAQEAAKIGVSLHKTLPYGKIFSFADYPETKKQIDSIIEDLKQSLIIVTVNGIRSAWTLSNNKNNALSRRIFGDNVGKLSQLQYRRYFTNNAQALDAFIARKTNGLNLSDRVWKYTDEFKHEIELGLDIGIRNGLSASKMARDLQQYLQFPDKLFRRIRDEHGTLRLSKAAKAFHPGQGVYRSSYKNARRLAVTETNIAYRTADHLRWQSMDFVIGVEVKLSGNHTCLGRDGKPHPFYDICDELKGTYPKGFKFTGWHPQCRCYAVPKLADQGDFMEHVRKMGTDGGDGNYSGEVTDMPDNFREWVKDNKDRIKQSEKRGTLPYFINDNRKSVKMLLGMTNGKIVSGSITGRVTPEIIQLRKEALNSGLFDFSTTLKRVESLKTTRLYLARKPLERIINHCVSLEEIDAVRYVWRHPESMRNSRISPLGEGKDMTNERAQKNIANKRKRGVVEYIEYEFEYAGKSWLIKTERHRNGFEQFYHIRKK